MAVYVVSYDLREGVRNYEPLYEALAQYENCHALESTWFIESDFMASEICADLCKRVPQQAQIYVVRLRREFAWCHDEKCSHWLEDPGRKW